MISMQGSNSILNIGILKNRSGDSKLVLTLDNGEKQVLRLLNKARYGEAVRDFTIMRELYDAGICIPEPLKIGFDNMLGLVCSMEFVDGDLLFNHLLRLSEAEQYDVGLRVVSALEKLNAFSPSTTGLPTLSEKIELLFMRFAEHRGSAHGAEKAVFQEIEKRFDSLCPPAPSFLHGDCSRMNIIVKPDGGICFIDFECLCMGIRAYDRASLLRPKHPAFNSVVLSAVGDDELPILALCNIIHLMRIGKPAELLAQESQWRQWYEWICEPQKMRAFYCECLPPPKNEQPIL